jgi:hypothetical protein
MSRDDRPSHQVQTTVERLKRCLSDESRPIFTVEVEYRDHQILPEEGLISHDPLMPIIVKRRSFAHESEVRLIMDRHRDIHSVTTRDDDQVSINEEALGPSKGESVAVDISILIEKIVTSPDYPEWARVSLQDRVVDAGLNLMVEESDLLKLPEADKIPYVSRRAG